MDFQGIGKLLLSLGVLLIIVGGVMYLLGRFGFNGLWGDIVIKRENFTFVFPIMTCIIVSIVLSIIMNLFNK